MSDNTRKYSLFPKTLVSCVEPMLRPVFKEKGLAGSRVLTDWASIVGPELAGHSIPEKISFPKDKKTGGTLSIAVENGFATELQYMQPVILERLAIYFGYHAVSRIAISSTFQPVREKTRPKQRDPVLPPGSARLADDVEDDELKTALASLAQTLSEPST